MLKYVILLLSLVAGTALADTKSIYINTTINPGTLRHQAQVLRDASPNDTILIHIDSDGGSMEESLYFIKTMFHSRAKEIITVVDEYAASAGADIMLSGDRILIKNDAEVMLHLGSLGTPSGKRITLSTDMQLSQLPPAEQNYYHSLISYMKKQARLLGLSTPQINKMLHGYDGITIKGGYLKAIHPSLKGGRKDGEYRQRVNQLIETL